MDQFGFIRGIGCESVRTFVFREMVCLQNNKIPFYVVQLDLTSAYNTANLWILKKLILRNNFWSKEEVELWEFIVTNSYTRLGTHTIKDVNGLPQGSLLSPMLFNLYINGLLVRVREIRQSRTIAYADDLITISPSL